MPISITLKPSSSVIGEIVMAKNKVKSLVYSGGTVVIPKISWIKLITPDTTTMTENHFIILTRWLASEFIFCLFKRWFIDFKKLFLGPRNAITKSIRNILQKTIKISPISTSSGIPKWRPAIKTSKLSSGKVWSISVSYTHLTLPTILLV